MHAVPPRVIIPRRDAGYIRYLNDIARSAEDTIRKRASCPRRRNVGVHRAELSGSLLVCNLIVGPLFFKLFVLLRSPLFDVESPYQED